MVSVRSSIYNLPLPRKIKENLLRLEVITEFWGEVLKDCNLLFSRHSEPSFCHPEPSFCRPEAKPKDLFRSFGAYAPQDDTQGVALSEAKDLSPFCHPERSEGSHKRRSHPVESERCFVLTQHDRKGKAQHHREGKAQHNRGKDARYYRVEPSSRGENLQLPSPAFIEDDYLIVEAEDHYLLQQVRLQSHLLCQRINQRLKEASLTPIKGIKTRLVVKSSPKTTVPQSPPSVTQIPPSVTQSSSSATQIPPSVTLSPPSVTQIPPSVTQSLPSVTLSEAKGLSPQNKPTKPKLPSKDLQALLDLCQSLSDTELKGLFLRLIKTLYA